MIYRTNPLKMNIGIQKDNLHYTFFHWKDHSSSTSKFKWLYYKKSLKESDYPPIGPTLLVEWEDD